MYQELQKLFDEHDTPTHAGTDLIHAQLRPIIAAILLGQKQAAEYRALFEDSRHVPRDRKLDGRLNGFEQALDSIDSATIEARKAVKRLSEAFTTVDQYLEAARVDVARYDAGQTPVVEGE